MARSHYIVILVKSIKGTVTSFQSPALSLNHVRNVCHTAVPYLTKFHFDSS